MTMRPRPRGGGSVPENRAGEVAPARRPRCYREPARVPRIRWALIGVWGWVSTMGDVPARPRTAILRGGYDPRRRLIEPELAERYSTSRFVLRNAVNRLATEGPVEPRPNRGARIREISIGIRRGVEGQMVRHRFRLSPRCR
jgi:hypothetical protein